jgi:ATP-dependent exoDNAse (exonuclease V) alpha subunit
VIATEHQKQKVEEALEILKKSNRLLIKGSAGVGKTTLIRFMLPFLKGKIVFSAPTHTAVGVIEKNISKEPNYKFSTIHRELQYKKIIDNKTGEKYFRPEINKNYPPLKNVSFFILDEASMIGVDMLDNIEKYCPPYCKLIFLGDDKQLFPVGESYKSVFLGKPVIQEVENAQGLNLFPHPTDSSKVVSFEPYPEIELTEIVRQGQGNPIIELSRNLPQIYSYVSNFNVDKESAVTGYFYNSDKETTIQKLAAVNGSTKLKYLAYTNAKVEEINKKVREHIYGKPQKIEKEEYIVFDEPYNNEYVTNQFLKVNDVLIDNIDFNVTYEDNVHMRGIISRVVTFKVYIVNPILVEQGNPGGVYIIHEDSESKFKQVISELNSNCRARFLSYVSKINFEDKFAKFKYAHALTIHKSQGQSFDKVIVSLPDINKCRDEKDSLLYTAITRPRNLVIFEI